MTSTELNARMSLANHTAIRCEKISKTLDRIYTLHLAPCRIRIPNRQCLALTVLFKQFVPTSFIKICSKVRYYIQSTQRAPQQLTYWLLICMLRSFFEHSVFSGIAILNAAPKSRRNEEFDCIIESALTLIQKTDPKRFRRIANEISTICNSVQVEAAKYIRLPKVCALDLAQFQIEDNDKDFTIISVALVLVHESTHGFLHARGIAKTKTNRRRIEALCDLESVRFAARLQTRKWDWSEIISLANSEHEQDRLESLTLLEKMKLLRDRWRDT